MKRLSWIGGLAALVFTLSTYAANVPTAKKSIEASNPQVAPAAQNQVLRIDGENADSDLRLRQWDITFYDANRANQGVCVRVRDGIVTSVGPAVRIFDDARWSRFERNFTGYDAAEVIKFARWKLDSTDALARVQSLPLLQGLQVVDAKMTLRKLSDGDVAPVWRVRVRARSKTQPGREGWIGYADLSAETGEILKDETRPQRLLR